MKDYEGINSKRSYQNPDEEQIRSTTAMINEVTIEETDNIIKKKKVTDTEQLNSPKVQIHEERIRNIFDNKDSMTKQKSA